MKSPDFFGVDVDYKGKTARETNEVAEKEVGVKLKDLKTEVFEDRNKRFDIAKKEIYNRIYKSTEYYTKGFTQSEKNQDFLEKEEYNGTDMSDKSDDYTLLNLGYRLVKYISPKARKYVNQVAAKLGYNDFNALNASPKEIYDLLKERLVDLGYVSKSSDIKTMQDMVYQITVFQQTNGLQVDSRMGPEFWEELAMADEAVQVKPMKVENKEKRETLISHHTLHDINGKELDYHITVKHLAINGKVEKTTSIEVFKDGESEPVNKFIPDIYQQAGFATYKWKGSQGQPESYIAFDNTLPEGKQFKEVALEQPRYKSIKFNVGGESRSYKVNEREQSKVHNNMLYKRVAYENEFESKYKKPKFFLNLEKNQRKEAMLAAPKVQLDQLIVDDNGNIVEFEINEVVEHEADPLGKVIMALPSMTFDQRNFLSSELGAQNINKLHFETVVSKDSKKKGYISKIGFKDYIPRAEDWKGLNVYVNSIKATSEYATIAVENSVNGKPVKIRSAFPSLSRIEPKPTKKSLRVAGMGKIMIVPEPSVKNLNSLEFANNKKVPNNVINELYYVNGEFTFMKKDKDGKTVPSKVLKLD